MPGLAISRIRESRDAVSNPAGSTSHAGSAQMSFRARQGVVALYDRQLVPQHQDLDDLGRWCFTDRRIQANNRLAPGTPA